jgi:hypothetical protein
VLVQEQQGEGFLAEPARCVAALGAALLFPDLAGGFDMEFRLAAVFVENAFGDAPLLSPSPKSSAKSFSGVSCPANSPEAMPLPTQNVREP